jgi:hypothetical protein
MQEKILVRARRVTVGEKILFDDVSSSHVVFADNPTTPALMPDGTVVDMTTPIVLSGGEARFMEEKLARVVVLNGNFIFAGNIPVPLKKIRGNNWGTVFSVPQSKY